jgi:hypothetical protein
MTLRLFRHHACHVCLPLGFSLLGSWTVLAGGKGLPPTPAVSTNAPGSQPPVNAGTNTNGGGTNAATQLETVVVTADLDAAREQIAPSLGAVTYTIGPNQIQSMGQGENASFQQVILQAPGVVQEEFGEVHVRGDHGDLQYRVNGVLLPESLNGFGQEIDTHLIHSVTLMTGTMPAQFGDRTAGIFDVTTKTAPSFRSTAAVTTPSIPPSNGAARPAIWITLCPPPICTTTTALTTRRPAPIRCMM